MRAERCCWSSVALTESPGLKSAQMNRATILTNGRLNTRGLLITYQSKKLQICVEGLAGLDDKELVRKLMEVRNVRRLVNDMPEAVDKLVKRK